MQILGFVDDFNIVGNTREDTDKALKVLEKSADKIGLKINVDKTKIMKLLETDTNLTVSIQMTGYMKKLMSLNTLVYV